MSSELDDFRNVLYLVWKHLRIPLDPTENQYEIAEWLQHGPRRRGVEGFRGIGKSWITVAYVADRLRKNPQMNITVVSASKQKADNFTTFLQQIIYGMPIFQFLIPRADQRCSKVEFDVGPAGANKDPSVISIGITGQMTGGRADLIIADDVEVPGNSETIKMREKLAEKVKEFDAILKPDGEVVYLGTPQNENTIYVELENRGYNFRIWPAEFPDKTMREKYGDRLSSRIRKMVEADESLVGHTTEPLRFTDIDLAERKASYGRSGYALQFMLDPSLSDADRTPLKLSDLIIHPVDLQQGPERLIWSNDPDYCIQDLPNVGMAGDRLLRPVKLDDTKYFPWDGKVMVIDPAGRGADETAYCVGFSLNGYVHIPDAGAFKGYDEKTLTALAEIAKKYQVHHIVVEPNFGDGMFSALLNPVLQRIYPCGIEELPRSSAQKERRICDTLEPAFTSHRVVIDPRLIERDQKSTEGYATEVHRGYQLFFQLTRITRDKDCLAHDDRIDALAMCVGYFRDHLAKDAEEGIKTLREQQLQQEIDEWHEKMLGFTPNEDSWIHLR